MAIETLEITREKFERVPRGYAIPGQAAVFIVDDDKAMRDPLHAALCLCGYRIFTATTRQEAEEVGAQLAPEPIKLVIANVHLIGIPHLQDGYVLLLRQPIAHYGQHTLSSGETPGGELSALLGRGTGSFLAKPFTMEELLDVVWAHLRHNHPLLPFRQGCNFHSDEVLYLC
jgi:DNA-binding response OmpR family regulator